MIIVSFGAGTNSTAMLIGMLERRIRPDAILFADTGSELPKTMRHVDVMRTWCRDSGFPDIETVRWGKYQSLEANLLEKRELPSPAYGPGRGCSVKFKRQPLDKRAKALAVDSLPSAKFLSSHRRGGQPRFFDCLGQWVRRAIGYSFDEPQRATGRIDFGVAWYPLIEWGWGRDECMDAIERAGIKQPGKSACFFCPMASSHGARDVLELARTEPELLRRAIDLENNAETRSIRGLGRLWAWGDMFDEDLQPKQRSLPMCNIESPCDCFDGDDT